MQFVASLVHSLAWPAGAVWLAIVLRKQIGALIAKERGTVEAGPFKTSWESAADTVRVGVVELEAAANTDALAVLSDLEPIAVSDPRQAIETAWQRIKDSLRSIVGQTMDLTHVETMVEQSSPPQLARVAESNFFITHQLRESIDGLAVLRNLAVHGKPATEWQAREFLTLAAAVLALLQMQSERPPSVGP